MMKDKKGKSINCLDLYYLFTDHKFTITPIMGMQNSLGFVKRNLQ